MTQRKKMIFLVLALALFAGVMSAILQKPNSPTTSNLAPKLGGDFELQGVNGSVKLSDFSGKAVLLFFGYTHCPDVCPITLANVSRALKEISPEKLDEFQMLFVSVDPKRDTVEHLNNYVQFFDKRFIGLTDSKENLDKVVRQYGAVYRIVELEDSAMGYGVDHSTRLYLIGKDGQIANYLYHDSSSADIAEKVSKIL